MKYGMLLWPYANGRYQQAVGNLAVKEGMLLLKSAGVNEQPVLENLYGVDWMVFSCPELSQEQIAVLRRHSSMYLFGVFEAGGTLRPICSREDAYLGADLSGILKYSGKTNEVFTRLLLNYAQYSGAFGKGETAGGRLEMLDFMCGRGTSLFEGLNRGFHVTGVDLSKKDIDEGFRYYKKYLEYHRLKHTQNENSRTLPGGKSVPVRTICATERGINASFIAGDAISVLRALKEKSFHLAVCDLPYGVQHAPGAPGVPGQRQSFDGLLAKVLPQVYRVMKTGAAVTLSFNENTIASSKVADAMTQAGFTIMEGPEYCGLSHWVEQAIERDVVTGIRTK